MKQFFKRYLPEQRKIREHKQLNKLFGKLLHDPNLLHLNRRSVSRAFSIGLFMAFMPMPFQMIPATAGAIAFRANLPITIGLVWISNPITIAPMSYFCYQVGAWLLNTPASNINFELSYGWITTRLSEIWEPFLLGCFLVATISALVGSFIVRLLWRIYIVQHWRLKKMKHKLLHKDK